MEKMAASRKAIFLLLFLMKNETVMGIIGNTQGVSNAVRPLRNAKMNKPMKPLLCSWFSWPLNVLMAMALPFLYAGPLVGILVTLGDAAAVSVGSVIVFSVVGDVVSDPVVGAVAWAVPVTASAGAMIFTSRLLSQPPSLQI